MPPLDKSYLILLGMVAGLVSVVLGYRLFTLGIEGSSTLEGSVKKAKLTLRNAAPGLFFALFGASIIVLGVWKKEIHSSIRREDGRVAEDLVVKGAVSPARSELPLRELLRLASDLRKNNDSRGAKILYVVSLAIREDAVAHNNLADLLLAEGSLVEAVRHAERAVALSNANPAEAENLSECYQTLATALVKQGKIVDAQRVLSEGLRLRPTDSGLKSLGEEILMGR